MFQKPNLCSGSVWYENLIVHYVQDWKCWPNNCKRVLYGSSDNIKPLSELQLEEKNFDIMHYCKNACTHAK